VAKQQWVVRDENGRIRGPYTTEDILRRIGEGVFSGEEQISKYPGNEWYPISHDPAFYDQILMALSGGIADIDERTERLDQIDRPEEEKEVTGEKASSDDPSKASQTAGTEEVVADPVSRSVDAFDFGNDEEEEFEVANFKSDSKEKSDGSGNKVNRASRITRPIQNKSEVIHLTDQKKVEKRAKKKASRKPLLAMLLILTLGLSILLLLEEGEGPKTSGEGLAFPRKLEQRPPNAEALAKQKLVSGTQNYLLDTLPTYKKAMQDIVLSLEYEPRDPGAWSWLCLTYYELWPYTSQSQKDLRRLTRATQVVAGLQPGGMDANTCKVAELMIKGQLEEASLLTNSVLNGNNGNAQPVAFYYFKAKQLTDPRDVYTAIGYVRSAQELLPQWMRVFSFEAELQMKVQKYSAAANIYNQILKATGQRHTISKLNLGIIEYRHFNRIENANGWLRPVLSQSKVEAPKELLGRAYLALAEISGRYQRMDDAKTFAQKSYAIDPTNISAKEMLMSLGGEKVLSGTQVDVTRLISVGDQFYREGNLEEAYAQYQAAYKLDTTSARAAMKSGQAMFKLGMTTDAITWLNRAIQSDYKLIEAYVTLAEFYAIQFDFLSANKILEKANKISPNNFEVYYGLANVQFIANNPQATISYGEKALKLYEVDTKTHILMAKAYLSLRDYNKAYASANTAVEIDSNNREAQTTLASALAEIQGPDAGVSYLQGLVEKYPLIIEYRMALANILLKAERYGDASQAFYNVIQIENKIKDAHLGLGKALKAQSDFQGALDSFLNGAAIDPSDPTAMFEAGLVYLQTKKYDLARKQFDRVLAVNPRYPLVHYYMGRTALLSRDYKEALRQSKEERRVNPNLPESYLLAAEAYLKTKKYSLCTREYGEAIKRQNLGAVSYVNMSRCYRLSGQLDIAIKMLNRAAEVESGYSPIWKEQGSIYETKGEYSKAVLSYEKYLALEPGAPDRGQIKRKILALQGK
tara:strand:- start:35056 stop:37992 length:2937 start_codon:yes stop_codon:yes gene_type:complete